MSGQDRTGQRFGRWVVLGRSADGLSTWRCRCDCGTEADKRASVLTRTTAPTRSCGCARGLEPTAGRTPPRTALVEYRAWRGIHERTKNVSDPDYGGRGISVCAQWSGADGFARFMEDMGRRPSAKHSIDRKDVNGNYEPANCRWATPAEQMQNQRTTRLNAETVNAIRQAHAAGEAGRAIARRLRAPQKTVTDVIHGRTWKEVA